MKYLAALTLMGLAAFATGYGLAALARYVRPSESAWWRQPMTGDEHRRIHRVWRAKGLDVRTGFRDRMPVEAV